jgi:predicted nucleic acid-binding protein
MAELFCDTSGWGHLVDSTQAYHTLATVLYRAARQQNRKIITTNYIVTELVALFTSPLRVPRLTTIGFIESLQTSPHIEIVHIDPTMHRQAWELLARREDKVWSLVDCASFAVMQERKITEALTTDRNFEQAGFIRLLRDE